MTRIKRTLVGVIAALCLAVAAFAHFPYLHYITADGVLRPAPEKFDLSALVDRRLPYVVSDQGPVSWAPNDSFPALLSQIRRAADAWNQVPTSELRLAFGGLYSPETLQASPRIEVLFDELPPGLIAMAGPVVRAEPVTGPDGAFVPIQRSILVLPREVEWRPSYSEGFFLTIVHELGHALGLQHTLTSSVMSTAYTRATTSAKPLADDDVAGISLLYPTPGYSSTVGSITGRVTLSDRGVHLASVVALSVDGRSVSTLTLPDGTYRMEGVPPGNYYVYTHTLPPAMQAGFGPADVVLPVDMATGQPVGAPETFEMQFYPGSRDLASATAVTVQAGQRTEGVNFAVQPRGYLMLFGVATYSFPGSVAVKPAFINPFGGRRFLVASGFGLAWSNAPAPGLNVTVMGDPAAVSVAAVRPYEPARAFVQIDFNFGETPGTGARHLVMTSDYDRYVLPAGLRLVDRQPPAILSASAEQDEAGAPLVRISGSDLSAETQILFDGALGAVRSFNSETGEMTVAPPPGGSGHVANLVALGADGQSSLFLTSQPPTYVYPGADAPIVNVKPAALPSGASAMVEIEGVNTSFDPRHARVGFGSSDVVVRRTWFVAPNRILANVQVSPAAPLGQMPFSLMAGLQFAAQPYAFSITAAEPERPSISPDAFNPVTNHRSLYPGGPVRLMVGNLPEDIGISDILVFLNGQPATVVVYEPGRVTTQIPADASQGAAIVEVEARGRRSFPVVLNIDPPPAAILEVLDSSGVLVSAENRARPGDTLRIRIAGVDPGAAELAPQRFRLVVGGLVHEASQTARMEGEPLRFELLFPLSSVLPEGDSLAATLYFDGRPSPPFMLPVVPPPPPPSEPEVPEEPTGPGEPAP